MSLPGQGHSLVEVMAQEGKLGGKKDDDSISVSREL